MRKPPLPYESEWFNPRAREERDRKEGEKRRKEEVSIHALAKSATFRFPDDFPRYFCFNPRAREERDKQARGCIAMATGFNPRAREERDECAQKIQFLGSCFNPRAREERDG